MENRERIIEGAAELFKIYGIKSVTMDSLANQLGISKRTIYELFADKDELLEGVLKSMADRQKDVVKRILEESENAIVAIFKMLEISRDHFQNMSPAFQADLKKYHHDVLMKKTDQCEMPDYSSYIQVIKRGISEKLFRKEINADLVNRCLYSLARSTMDHNLYPFEQFSRKDVIKNVFISYLRGISTADGLNLINKLEKNY
jgi:TetR/AcrR family transcriptional regulator, cholesterol catabolism regulator